MFVLFKDAFKCLEGVLGLSSPLMFLSIPYILGAKLLVIIKKNKLTSSIYKVAGKKQIYINLPNVP